MRRRSILCLLTGPAGAILAAAVLAAALVFNRFAALYRTLPSEEDLRNFSPVLSTKILDRAGELITELYTEKRTWTNYRDLPEHLISAVLAIEDHEFYRHWGVSPRGILRALASNMRRGGLTAGGSTITQQLAKVSFLSHRRTFGRKIKELVLALKLEQNYSKNEILEMYLNQVYLGNGAYGISQAARIYFAKNVPELTLAESAMIAGLIRSPMYYSPLKHPERARERRNVVLKRMYRLRRISRDDYLAASASSMTITTGAATITRAPYFVEYIREQLERRYPPETLYNGGLVVHTTLDARTQKYAEEVFSGQLAAFERARPVVTSTDPAAVAAANEPVQGALIALDVKTGGILALIGGRDFRVSQFNRAMQARRQPGSSFKPIVYLTALQKGFLPNSVVNDVPLMFYNDGVDWRLLANSTDYLAVDLSAIAGRGRDLESFRLLIDSYKAWQEYYTMNVVRLTGGTTQQLPADVAGELKILEQQHRLRRDEFELLFSSLTATLRKANRLWSPENYHGRYHGPILFRRALEFSLNSVSVQLVMEVGPSAVIENARRLGITTPLTNTLALGLGSSEVVPLELVGAYTVFANNGIRTTPFGILEVRDRFNNVLERHQPEERIVLKPEEAFLVTNLLKGVVTRGTGGYARSLGRICAGKTGTTNDCSDAWFIGYTPDIVCGVWVGYDTQRSLGPNATGGRVACPIWTEFMRLALKGTPNTDFVRPDTIVDVEIDAATGLPAGPRTERKYTESFIAGTEPQPADDTGVSTGPVLTEPAAGEQESGF